MPDIDQLWTQFQSFYMPDENESNYESNPLDSTASEKTSLHPLDVPKKYALRCSHGLWRSALIAAIAMSCFFAIMITAQAAGIDVFGAVARWTEDIFSFGQIQPDSVVSEIPNQTSQEFRSVQEALDLSGISDVHEPLWLPGGFALDQIEVTNWDDPFLIALNIVYINKEEYLAIDIMSYADEPSMQIQKNGGGVETLEENGVTFYLIENTANNAVAWHTDAFEYCVSGNMSKATLWEIVHSMII